MLLLRFTRNMHKRLHFRSAVTREILGDDDHVLFDARTADDVRCARGAPQRGVATQYREIRRSGTKVTSVLNVL